MINKKDNYLTEELFNKVWDVVESASKDNKFSTNAFNWESHLVMGSSPVLIYDIASNHPELMQELCRYDVEQLGVDMYDDNKEVCKSIYFWTNGSYIPWHADEVYSWASTLYLNKEYNHDWGGFFLYKDEDEIRGFIPQPNRMIEQSGGVPHSTTDLRHGDQIPYRISLQTFMADKDSPEYEK